MTGAPTFIAWSITLQIFLRMGLRQGAAEHGEVLAEHEHQATVDAAVAGDDAIAGDFLIGHAEVAVAVLDELVPLLETAFVKQQADALPSGQLALGVLLLDAALTTTEQGGCRLGG